MPVRVFGNASGGGTKGYPTADVSNITGAPSGGLKILLKWTDPEDTVLDNAVLSSWHSTLIVRKMNSVPESVKDGVLILENTVKNQYQNTWYEDTNSLIDGATYYYRFFTKSTEGIIGDGSPTIKVTASEYSDILANNTWDLISEAAESGIAKELWDIGDEIDISVGGTFSGTYTLQIWDFEHYEKSDGSGKAGILFGTKGVVNTDITCAGDRWVGSGFRANIVSIFDELQASVKDVIKEVRIPYNYPSNRDDGSTYTGECTEKIFTPTHTEIGSSGIPYVGYQFPIFTDDQSRIKKNNNGSGYAQQYSLRSIFSSKTGFYRVGTEGSTWTSSRDHIGKFCFCFCV